jgi:hypothetical protein
MTEHPHDIAIEQEILGAALTEQQQAGGTDRLAEG